MSSLSEIKSANIKTQMLKYFFFIIILSSISSLKCLRYENIPFDLLKVWDFDAVNDYFEFSQNSESEFPMASFCQRVYNIYVLEQATSERSYLNASEYLGLDDAVSIYTVAVQICTNRNLFDKEAEKIFAESGATVNNKASGYKPVIQNIIKGNLALIFILKLENEVYALKTNFEILNNLKKHVETKYNKNQFAKTREYVLNLLQPI